VGGGVFGVESGQSDRFVGCRRHFGEFVGETMEGFIRREEEG
jgi:hypothetical protein